MVKKNKNLQKSILRYPGGKSRAVDIILNLIPENTTKMIAPFFGGGSIELACASIKNIEVEGYDIFIPLVNFWKCLLDNPKKLGKIIRKYHPLSKKRFYELQKEIMITTNQWDQAAIFFVLNRASFSGSTLSGGMSPSHPRFNIESIERLESFTSNKLKNKLFVEAKDFSDVIKSDDSTLLYCDPPYLIKNKLYGDKGNAHKNFDHKKLFDLLENRKNWILSYNNCPEIREMYKNYEHIIPQWKYGMGKDKDSKEIIILSPDLMKKFK